MTPGARAAGYLAVGDSYAAGVGTGAYYGGSGDCLRAPGAYAPIVAARLDAPLAFTACSGARISDVEEGQLGPLDFATDWVTVTIGGNDAGFGRVVTSCALPRPWSCGGDIEAARRFIRGVLPARLDNLFATIAGRAPAARVAVVGYPRAFDGESCDPGAFFSPAEEELLNRTANLLARTEAGRARAHGFLYVDPRRAFEGHEICDPSAWINGLSYPLVESFHPNVAGYRAYARLVFGAFRSTVAD